MVILGWENYWVGHIISYQKSHHPITILSLVTCCQIRSWLILWGGPTSWGSLSPTSIAKQSANAHLSSSSSPSPSPWPLPSPTPSSSSSSAAAAASSLHYQYLHSSDALMFCRSNNFSCHAPSPAGSPASGRRFICLLGILIAFDEAREDRKDPMTSKKNSSCNEGPWHFLIFVRRVQKGFDPATSETQNHNSCSVQRPFSLILYLVLGPQ